MFDADGITCTRGESTEPATEPQKSILLGDADGDGVITVADATIIQRYLAEIDVPVFIETAADADEDGTVDAMDATVIRRLVAGLQSFPNIDTPVESTE